MSKKDILFQISNLLVWICCLIVVIVRPYSKIVAWIFFCLQLVFLLVVIILFVSEMVEFKKQEKEFQRTLEENRKHLEELIKEYSAVLLKSEEENKEEQE